MVTFLTKQLDLTAAQQDSVGAVLRRHRPELDAIWHLVHPRFDSLRTTMHREISAQLTPSQQTRYHALVQRYERPQPKDDSTSREQE